MADNSTKANFVAKTLFIAGGIILFIVLVIFIFKMVPVAVSNLSNLGSNISSKVKNTLSGDEIIVTTETPSVDVKTPVVLSFEYTPKDSGQYFFSYKCIDGLFFDIQSQDGPKRVICDTPLKLGADLNSISIVPLFTQGNTFADSVVTISYRDAKNNSIASGSKTLTIKGDQSISTSTSTNPFSVNGSLSGSSVTTKPITTSTKIQTSNAIPVSYSRPTKDLAITYISSIDSQSTFVIHVYNYGNTSTGPWEFSYTDAENPSRTVSSPIQASLAANQGLAVTVRFDGQDNSKQTIEVIADPLNKISESNESNNKASVNITGSNSNNNSGSYNSKDDADLIITSMQVGKISGNRFIEDDEIDEDDTAAVRFIVKNQGGESSGSWRFEIDNLPYDNDDSYRSKSYSSLKPGQSIEIIADFDGINDGRYSIKVEVDSDDDVDEEKENNNTESETLEVNR